jgi:hypothetical protein
MRRAQAVRGFGGHRQQAGRGQQQHRITAGQLHAQLFDIGFPPAKAGGQRQRHRQCAGAHHTEKRRGKISTGFRDQGDAVAGLHPLRHQLARPAPGIGGQFGIGIGAHQIGTGIVEIIALGAKRCIIKRFNEGGKIRPAHRQIIACRRCSDGGCRLSCTC